MTPAPVASSRRGWQPLDLLACLGGCALLLVIAVQPIRDEDIWWHVLVGAEIAESRRITGVGNGWAPFGNQDWATTQWLSELLYASLHSAGGWHAIAVLRVVIAALTIVGLGMLLLYRRPVRSGVIIYLVTLAGLALWLSRGRPQSLVLPLTVLLAYWLRESLIGRWPPFVAVPLIAALWANLHGSWVLLPAVWALVALAAVFEQRWRDVRWSLLLLLTSLLGGLLTPLGVSTLAASFRFQGTTSHILEWGPTPLVSVFGLALLAVGVIVLISWGRSRPVLWGEVVVVAGVVSLGLSAARNVPSALILLAPLAADRMSRIVPEPSPRPAAESKVLAVLGSMAIATTAMVAPVLAARAEPLSAVVPVAIARELGRQGEVVRVLNDYGTGGVLAAFGAPHVEVAIDGRADRYSPAYVSRYLDAQFRLVDWQDLLDEVQPDVAVLPADAALAAHLQDVGWTVAVRESGFMLLEPPQERAG